MRKRQSQNAKLVKFAKSPWLYLITSGCNIISTQRQELAMLRGSGITGFGVLAFIAAGVGWSYAADQCSLELLEANSARAAEVCTSVLNQDDATTAARVNALKIRGRAMQRLMRNDDAILDYEAGLRIAPDDAELHLRRGWTAFDELRRGVREGQNLEVAIEQARQALNLKPGYADAFRLIGASFSLGGPDRFAQAKAAYDEAIRLEPANPEYRHDRLVLLENNKFFAEAIEEADAILGLPAELITKPSTVDSFQKPTTFRIAVAMRRAPLLKTVGRTEEARQAYDRAVELDPDALTYARRAAFKLSQIAYFPGMPSPPLDGVQDDLDKALALDPDYWVSHDQQGYLHSARGQYDLAAMEFARALKQYPAFGRMRWSYATTLRKLGRNEEAAAEAITAFRLDPGFMSNKLGRLQKLGYLAAIAPDVDPRPALMDAARACMLDEGCD